jgi:DNA-binding NtrC family response regulator
MADIGKIKILVVDDEPDLALLMQQQFEKDISSGRIEFVFAQDGVEGLQKIYSNPDIEIVLADINMPMMDGMTLLTNLLQYNPLIRTVMVSAYGDMDNIRRAMNRGAFDFVTKPINFEDLRVTLNRTI